jgi:signal transduction histidine kinase/CheY-like chemotaxis protein
LHPDDIFSHHSQGQQAVKHDTASTASNKLSLREEDINTVHVLRETSAHITKAARSATLANVLAPLTCIPMFIDEVVYSNLVMWLYYMLAAVSVRTWMIFRLAHEADKILDPKRNLQIITFALGLVGFGWGLGWILLAPDLLMVNRMIYVYMTTAAMISSMFAYSVNTPTFLAFTLPIMIPSLSSVLWTANFFPWPFTVGLASLYLIVFKIAKSFAQTFQESIRLRFRNERLYQELANERDQSIAANVAKSKFIAVASHDLRQPMHAVNVYLELIQLDDLPPQEKTIFTKIRSSITTLNAMFDSLLNISQLDADVMQVSHRAFSLKELGYAIRDLTEATALDKGLKLNLVCPDCVVHGDKLLLQQIIINLVSNAIQYTEAGGVELRFEIEEDCLVIEVSDTGCGIAEAEQAQIFNEFFRADRTRSLHDGLGLGLSIVQRLSHLIGAEVSVLSEVGVGSRFTVTTSFSVLVNEEDAALARPTLKAPHLRHMLHGKHIAVIEDNPIIVEAYRHTLASKGAYVQVLSEHEDELFAQLESIDHLDCILCDYRLSQTTGDLLIGKIRENYNEDIPAIIVTADTTPSHINVFAALNVQVLHKPISFQEIAQAIERIIITG